MTTVTEDHKEFEDRFRKHIQKVTGQDLNEIQVEVCRQVCDFHAHFTEEQMRNLVRKSLADIPEGAVRNTLEEMIHAGLIRKVFFGGEHFFYEHVFGHLHHDHLFCVECGKILEFRNEEIETLQEKIATDNGFQILRHHMQIIGLCDECKGKASHYNTEFHDRHQPQQTMPLLMVKDGQQVTIAQIRGGRGMKLRLAEMGVYPGEKLLVIQNRFAGPFIINIKGSRLIVPHKLAHHIYVQGN